MTLENAMEKVRENADSLRGAFQVFNSDVASELSLEDKVAGVEAIFAAFQEIFGLKRRDKELVLAVTDGGPWAYNDSGHFIRAPKNSMAIEGSEEIAFTMAHEYGHALLGGSGFPFYATKLAHDAARCEAKATQFAFGVLEEFGLNVKKIGRYEDWTKAIDVRGNMDLLEKAYEYEAGQTYFKLHDHTAEKPLYYTNVKGVLKGIRLKVRDYSYRRDLIRDYMKLKKAMTPPKDGVKPDEILAEVKGCLDKVGVKFTSFNVKVASISEWVADKKQERHLRAVRLRNEKRAAEFGRRFSQ